MFNRLKNARVISMVTASLMSAALFAPAVSAQPRPAYPGQQQQRDWDWDGNYRRLARINAGTFITVRTTQPIQANDGGRVFRAIVVEDVWDDYGRLAVPLIPRGSRVDLTVRPTRSGDLVLDLQVIYANGQTYVVSTQSQRVEGSDYRHDAGDAAQWVGGGAILGSIIGGIAGGGKGAAIGAGAGAATGLGAMAYTGRSIQVPSGSELTFRLDRPLDIRTAPPRPRPYTPNDSYYNRYPR